MKKTLYRYLAKEIFPSFLLGLVGFTFILLTGRILQLVELFVNKRVPLFYILGFLYYLLPSFLVLTIPMATLLSVMLAFNRLSGDNEITALKASGVSVYQLTPPVLLFALFTTLATLILSLYSLPRANEASRALLYEMASSKAHAGIKERVFNDDFEGLVLYADRVNPSGAHHSNHTRVWRVLKTGDPRQIRPCISTPVTEKGQDFGFKSHFKHLNSIIIANCKISN